MTMDTMEREDTALIAVPEGQNAYALFTAKGTVGADKLLAMVRAKVDAFKADLPSIETETGRKKIKSFAYKIAQSKTAIDVVGKEIVDEAKELPKRIDANRKHIKDTLDAWRDEVRQPVTDWEKAEEARVNRIKSGLEELQAIIADTAERASEVVRERLLEVHEYPITEDRFAEYTEAARELWGKAVAALEARLAATEKREAEAAELARLRAEAEERARKDHEAEIARKAAEDAKREAEEKAEAERRAAQQREADLKAAAAKAEQDRRDAEQRAADAEKAAKEKAERDAREAKEREEAAQRQREQNKAHMAAINREALAALVENGIDVDVAKNVIVLIATRTIPHVSIQY